MSKPKLTVTSDFTDDFKQIIDRFKNDAILIGIPEEKSPRRDEQDITNAALLAINNFGSPANNIPPRPVMSIGIKNAQDAIADQFANGVKLAFKKGMSGLEAHYNRVGSIAANSIKKAINDQDDIEEPAESTLRARKARGFKGTKSLVVTGQMRNAITWVVTRWGK